MFRAPILFTCLLSLILGAVACAPSGVEVVSETDEKQYQLGQDYKNQGRMEEALGCLLYTSDAADD